MTSHTVARVESAQGGATHQLENVSNSAWRRQPAAVTQQAVVLYRERGKGGCGDGGVDEEGEEKHLAEGLGELSRVLPVGVHIACTVLHSLAPEVTKPHCMW